jgi:hypothetical protein
MTTKKKGSGQARKLKLKKETLKDLDASRGKRIKGGAVSAEAGVVCHTVAATCFCTAAATNCKVSCVAVCGGGGTLLG